MFTKEDPENFFEQLARVQRKMVYGAYELGALIDDPSLAGALKKIGDDEVRHYSSVLRMLEVTKDSSVAEHRREPREYCLGTIQLRSIKSPENEEISARCVNLSTNGICLESAEGLLPGSAWELEIQLFDKDGLMAHRGRIVWCKEIETGLYMSGIEFGP
jgi:hypothetical protein